MLTIPKDHIDYDSLGSLIMLHGLEVGLSEYIGNEENFCHFVSNLESDIFAATDVLETLIVHLIREYLKCYNREEEYDEVKSMLEKEVFI